MEFKASHPLDQSTKLSRLLALAFASLSSSPVLAHTGNSVVTGFSTGFSTGFAHPFLWLDHILAIIAVGILAGLLGRRARVGLLLAFLSTTLVGVILAVTDVEIPAAEIGIATSVLLLGTAVAFRLKLPGIAVVACGTFDLVHGDAHGIEMGQGASALHFIAGFVIATVFLHAGGLAVAAALVRTAPVLNRVLGEEPPWQEQRCSSADPL